MSDIAKILSDKHYCAREEDIEAYIKQCIDEGLLAPCPIDDIHIAAKCAAWILKEVNPHIIVKERAATGTFWCEWVD